MAKKPIPNKPGATNWVSEAGGLPDYARRIAEHLHGKGHSVSTSIAMSINTLKRWSTGKNHNGGKLKPGTVAKAAAAVAQWEKMKASTKAKAIKEAADWSNVTATPDELAGLGVAFTGRLNLVEGLLLSMRDDPRSGQVAAATDLLEGRVARLVIGGAKAKADEVRGVRRALVAEAEVLRDLVEALADLDEGAATLWALNPDMAPDLGGLGRIGGNGRAARLPMKRLPDGSFAPKGQGVVLRGGNRVRVPHRRRGMPDVKGVVDHAEGPELRGKVRLESGPDKGTAVDMRNPEEEANHAADLDRGKRAAEGMRDFKAARAAKKAAAESGPSGRVRKRTLVHAAPGDSADLEEAGMRGIKGKAPAPAKPPKPPAELAQPEGERKPLPQDPAEDRTTHLQNRLTSLGKPLTVDGHYGPRTTEAVKSFQREGGLEEDGIVGPKTTEKLRSPDSPGGASEGKPGAADGERGEPGADGADKQDKKASVLFKGMGVGDRSGNRDVKGLQEDLTPLGYHVEKDGRFGPETEGAVKRMQRRYGLKTDGIAGEKTLRTIKGVKSHKSAEAVQEAAFKWKKKAGEGEDNDGGGAKRCPSCKWKNAKGKTTCTKCKGKLSKDGDAKLAKADDSKAKKREAKKLRESLREARPRPTEAQIDARVALQESLVGRGARAVKRLPDGTFAPVGRGRILRAGDRVTLPGGDTAKVSFVRNGHARLERKGEDVGLVKLASPPVEALGRSVGLNFQELGSGGYVDRDGLLTNKGQNTIDTRGGDLDDAWDRLDEEEENAKAVLADIEDNPGRRDPETGFRDWRPGQEDAYAEAEDALERIADAKTARPKRLREALNVVLEEAGVKRGAAPGKLIQLKRLPDGQFAPKGLGQVLRPGMKVEVPHKGGDTTVKGTVEVDRKVRLDTGPDVGQTLNLKKPDAVVTKPKPPAAKKTSAGDYLSEKIGFGGETLPRGEVIEELRKTGASQAMIDRYLQGSDRGSSPKPPTVRPMRKAGKASPHKGADPSLDAWNEQMIAKDKANAANPPVPTLSSDDMETGKYDDGTPIPKADLDAAKKAGTPLKRPAKAVSGDKSEKKQKTAWAAFDKKMAQFKEAKGSEGADKKEVAKLAAQVRAAKWSIKRAGGDPNERPDFAGSGPDGDDKGVPKGEAENPKPPVGKPKASGGKSLAKPNKKPYSGGPYVVLQNIGSVDPLIGSAWSQFGGANTPEAAKKMAAKVPGETKVWENKKGSEPHPGTYTSWGEKIPSDYVPPGDSKTEDTSNWKDVFKGKTVHEDKPKVESYDPKTGPSEEEKAANAAKMGLKPKGKKAAKPKADPAGPVVHTAGDYTVHSSHESGFTVKKKGEENALSSHSQKHKAVAFADSKAGGGAPASGDLEGKVKASPAKAAKKPDSAKPDLTGAVGLAGSAGSYTGLKDSPDASAALGSLEAASSAERKAALAAASDKDLAGLYLTAQDANLHAMNTDVKAELEKRGFSYGEYKGLASGKPDADVEAKQKDAQKDAVAATATATAKPKASKPVDIVAAVEKAGSAGSYTGLENDPDASAAMATLDDAPSAERKAAFAAASDEALAGLSLTAQDANFHALNKDVTAELTKRGYDPGKSAPDAGAASPAEAQAQASLADLDDGELDATLSIAQKKATGHADDPFTQLLDLAKAEKAERDGGGDDPAKSAALEAFKAQGGTDPAILAALGEPSGSGAPGPSVGKPEPGVNGVPAAEPAPKVDTVAATPAVPNPDGSQTPAQNATGQYLGAEQVTGAPSGLQQNTSGTDLASMSQGQEFQDAKGQKWAYHKPTSGGEFHVVKPGEGNDHGKAKVFHGKMQPPMVGPSGGSSGPAPDAPAAKDDDLFGKLATSVDQAKKTLADGTTVEKKGGVTTTTGPGAAVKQTKFAPDSVANSPGRGPSGKMRNFKVMGVGKLKGVIEDLEDHGGDPDALTAAKAAMEYTYPWAV